MLKFLIAFLLLTATQADNNDKQPNPNPKTKIISCWNPASGSQITCPSPTSFCQTNLTTGEGLCKNSCAAGSNLLCCKSGSNCNKMVTSCYDLASKTFNKCSQSGTDKFCQISLPGPFYNPVTQFATASGTCQSSCTPSNLNSATLTFCCFAQDNCNYFPPTSGK